MNKKLETTPLCTYINIENEKNNIYNNNKNKSGIYRWINKIDGKTYIGSSVKLDRRFSQYLSIKNIKRIVENESSYIYRAIIKHGYINFTLEILEYCDKNIIIEREQYYIDKLKPEYNILKTANTRKGYEISFNTRKAISISLRKRKLLHEETSTQQISNKCTTLTSLKKDSSLSKIQGVKVKIFNKAGNLLGTFPTLNSAANYLNISVVTVKKIYYSGISFDDYIYEFEPKDIKIKVYNSNYQLIDITKNAKDTCTKYNIGRTSLFSYINSNKIFKNKFYFYNNWYNIYK